ncbi:MAG: SGNH/GDSL hydrolase family protein [Novosphingobium sp.]
MWLRQATVALAALLLASCSVFGGRPQGSEAVPGGRYVAMGSSMAAGPGLGPPKPDTPARCMRTFANYPTRLAERLLLTLFDATCSGATTDHILGPWNELPAQIDAVTADTDLVTVTIGGNDLNYVGGLLAATCGAEGTITIAGNVYPCPPRRLPLDEDFDRVEANLREIARQVKARAPKARLVFVQYLTLVPDVLCDATPISPQDADIARGIAARLASITAKVARETRAMVVPADLLSRNHTPCDAEPWAVGSPPDYDGSQGAPWHPNFSGMKGVADALAAQLGG